MHLYFLVLAVLIAADAGPRFVREDRVLAEVPTRDDTLRVLAGIIRDLSKDAVIDSSVESMRVVNRRGTCLYSDTFLVRKGSGGPLYAQTAVDAWAIRWSGGAGFRLRDEAVNPSMRRRFGPDYHCRYLAVRGDSVVPVIPWCRLCGDLLSGDRVLHLVDLGVCCVEVPLRVRFDLPGGGLEVDPLRDESVGGLAVLETKGAFIHWWPEDPQSPNAHLYPAGSVRRAFLCRSVVGAAGDSITVTPDSSIAVGRAYLRCAKWANLGYHCPEDFDVELVRLEFTVGGRRGFLDERGIEAIGFANPSREIHFGPGGSRLEGCEPH